VDVEILKRALRELVEREPTFFRDLFLDALRADGRIAEALLDLFTKHPEAKLRLAQAVAESVAVPLNVATKEDLKQLATKQDIKRLEDQMATKEDLKQFATKMNVRPHLQDREGGHFLSRGSTISVRPSLPTTLTVEPAATNPDDLALHTTPWTLTSPVGFRSVTATPTSPMSDSGPAITLFLLAGPAIHLM